MMENPDACVERVKLLKAYCTDLHATGRAQRFVWEETLGVESDRSDPGHRPLIGVPEARDRAWQRLIRDTLKAEGMFYEDTPDGFIVSSNLR